MKDRMKRSTAVLVGIGILSIAAVAIALLLSRQDSAQETVTAKSIGQVDIGDVATLGIFPTGTLSNLEPGAMSAGCLTTEVTSPQAGDAPKLYLASQSGTLADDLQIQVWTGSSTNSVGRHSCSGTIGMTSVYTGPLSGFPTTYALGKAWGSTKARWHFGLTLPVAAGDVQGQSATFAFAFENQRP